MPLEEGEIAGAEGSDNWEQLDGETGGEAPEGSFEEPEYDFLDTTEYGSKHVKLTVDGEEVVVPLADALNGYNAASVSTKRFQEAAEKSRQAEEALRLQQAFVANPGLTIQVIAAQQGMSVEDFLGLTPRQQQAMVEDAEDEYVDPLELQLRQLNQKFESQEERLAQREADERLQRAVGGLKATYGATDDQAKAVVLEAMNRQLSIEAFPMIFESMAYRAQQQAGAQQTAQQEAEAQRRREAAARAARTVSSGSRAPGVTTQSAAPTYGSLRDAITASLEEVESRTR